jgi:hypothetical protein
MFGDRRPYFGAEIFRSKSPESLAFARPIG